MNKKGFKILSLALLLIHLTSLISHPTYSYPKIKKEGTAPFLKLGTSVKGSGMGGVGVATEFSADSVHFNPANLSFLPGLSLTSMNNNLRIDRRHNSIGVAQNFKFGSVGLSWLNLGVSGVEVWNELDQKLGETSDKEDAYFISYARRFKNTGLGVTYKIIRHSLHNRNAKGNALDIGISQKINNNLTVGIAFQNLGGKLKWDTPSRQKDKMYRNTKIGAAYKFLDGKATLAVDVNQCTRDSTSIHFGGEYIVADILALRAGSNNGKAAFGVGVNYLGFNIDYAYVSEDLQNSQQISISYSPIKKKIRKIEKIVAKPPVEKIEPPVDKKPPQVEEEKKIEEIEEPQRVKEEIVEEKPIEEIVAKPPVEKVEKIEVAVDKEPKKEEVIKKPIVKEKPKKPEKPEKPKIEKPTPPPIIEEKVKPKIEIEKPKKIIEEPKKKKIKKVDKRIRVTPDKREPTPLIEIPLIKNYIYLWVILIIVGVAVVTWFIFYKNKRRKSKNKTGV